MSRLSLRVLLRSCHEDVLRECLQRWGLDAKAPAAVKPRLGLASSAMEDEAVVLQRIGMLPRKLQDLLEAFFALVWGIAMSFYFCWQEALVAFGLTPVILISAYLQAKYDPNKP